MLVDLDLITWVKLSHRLVIGSTECHICVKWEKQGHVSINFNKILGMKFGIFNAYYREDMNNWTPLKRLLQALFLKMNTFTFGF